MSGLAPAGAGRAGGEPAWLAGELSEAWVLFRPAADRLKLKYTYRPADTQPAPGKVKMAKTPAEDKAALAVLEKAVSLIKDVQEDEKPYTEDGVKLLQEWKAPKK